MNDPLRLMQLKHKYIYLIAQECATELVELAIFNNLPWIERKNW